MEKVGGFVPVNPHSSQIVSQQVVQRVSRQETQAVRDPISLFSGVIEVGLCPSSQVANRLRSFAVGLRPDPESNAIKRLRRVLLEDERVVDTVWLAPACADFDIMREARLQIYVNIM